MLIEVGKSSVHHTIALNLSGFCYNPLLNRIRNFILSFIIIVISLLLYYFRFPKSYQVFFQYFFAVWFPFVKHLRKFGEKKKEKSKPQTVTQHKHNIYSKEEKNNKKKLINWYSFYWRIINLSIKLCNKHYTQVKTKREKQKQQQNIIM